MRDCYKGWYWHHYFFPGQKFPIPGSGFDYELRAGLKAGIYRNFFETEKNSSGRIPSYFQQFMPWFFAHMLIGRLIMARLIQTPG